MVSIPRINYNRATYSIRQLTNRLSFNFQRLRSLAIGIILVIITFQIFLLSTGSNSSVKKIKALKGGQIQIVDKNSIVATHYKTLLKKHSENFPSFPFQKKCALYFKELYNENHDWEIVDIEKDTNKDYDKSTFDHDRFIRDKINDYKEKNNKEEPSEGKIAEFELEFQKSFKMTQETEQAFIDAMTHLRVFGACFLDPENQQSKVSEVYNSWFGNNDEELASVLNSDDIDLCYDIEQRLFPWLSRELPLFVRWDGEKVYGIPKMSKYIDVENFNDVDIPFQKSDDIPEDEDIDNLIDDMNISFLNKRSLKNACFLNNWRSALNGKGIVLSVADKYESDIIGLLRVLRGLNNKLPIQLVHKGDLSEDVQKRISKIARADEVDVPLYLYEKIKGDIPHNFPKQEVWFVNAKRCIKENYRGHFKTYANKLIAYLFNSFDDILLMDTDSVPLVKPAKFFESGPYKRTQSYFFKDRFNAEKVSKHDSDYFLKLMPTAVDEALFEIPRVSNLTLENRYIKDQFRHVMEAGVVGLRRSTHFIGILTSIQMNFWAATSSRIWGDKELFWLGQSISGNENYEFNQYDVVAVGELTPMSERPRNTIAHELCSTHPGHLSGDDDFTLLWINSGFRYCKVNDVWNTDINHEKVKNRFTDVKVLEEFYRSPLKINAALIPPGGDRTKLNEKNEPARGWEMNAPCKGYLWCAYDIIGGSVDPRDRGAYVEYNNITELTNEYLGKLWLNQDLVPISKYEERVKADLKLKNEKLKEKELREKELKEKGIAESKEN